LRSASRIGLIGGGAFFLLLLLVPGPAALSPEGWRAAAVAVLMAVWWMTEAIPIPATALLPLALFPTLGVLDMPAAAAPYANEIIFLFMGGFIIAMAMERWGLHRRIALGIMAFIGTSPKRLILGFMVATAFLSMWISNTATATMMLPIAMAVAEVFRPKDLDPETQPYHFGIALMLGIAYAASIGGVATLIGTPPNAVMAAAAEELLDIQIGFVEWMAVGLPVAAFTLPLAWFVLVNFLHHPGEVSGDAASVIHDEQRAQGKMSRGEKSVAIVFFLAAISWVLRSPKELGAVTIPGIETFAPGVRDSTIAMVAAVILFLIPVNWRKGEFAMTWTAARKMPWGVLILFGGGLSLARAMDQTGLAAWIGGGVGALGGLPQVVLLALVATLFVFLTEVTSNTATATMAMPIMVGVAAGLGYPAITLMATAALSSSMAFMLPVATPPNAIVFSSEYLTIPRMARAGFWMNIMAIAVITLTATLLIPHLLAN
jgi:sodium-dependent dicarboxylate transporter 2/3/5